MSRPRHAEYTRGIIRVFPLMEHPASRSDSSFLDAFFSRFLGGVPRRKDTKELNDDDCKLDSGASSARIPR